jgi:hypothetical protein
MVQQEHLVWTSKNLQYGTVGTSMWFSRNLQLEHQVWSNRNLQCGLAGSPMWSSRNLWFGIARISSLVQLELPVWSSKKLHLLSSWNFQV